MAEYVHLQMETMVPEFQQMQRVELFTEKEVKEMVKKRRDFEYKLVQRQKQKKYYLSYIQYEICVLDIITQRRKKMKYYHKKDEMIQCIQYAIVQRIHRVFRNSLIRWSNDMDLWMSHAKFCLKWKKKIQLSKLCTKMLAMHGHKPQLWILAAKWEFECGQSEDNCRNLFLKALQLHENHKEILREYFRAELLIVEKKRRRLMLLRNNAAPAEEEDDDEEDDEDRAKDKMLMSGGLARIVYQTARQAYPEDGEFAVEFAQVAKLFVQVSFGEKIFNEIRADLRASFPAVAQVCSALAMFKVEVNQTNYEAKDKVMEQNHKDELGYKEMQQAVDSNPDSAEMKNENFNFAFQLFTTKAHPNSSVSEQRFNKLLQIVDDVGSSLSDENLTRLAKMLNSKAQYDVTVAKIGDRHLSNGELAFLRLQARTCNLDSSDDDVINGEFVTSLPLVDDMCDVTRDAFWNMWMGRALVENDLVLAEKIACEYCQDVNVQICFVKWFVKVEGVERAYQMYKKKMMRTNEVSFHEKLLKLFSSCDLNRTEAKQMHENGVRLHGATSVHLWIEYLKFATEPIERRRIYNRAQQSLEGKFVQDFEEAYNRVSTGN